MVSYRNFNLYTYSITLRMGEYEHCWKYYCKAFTLQQAWIIAKESLIGRSYWNEEDLREDEDHGYWSPGDEAYLQINYVYETQIIELENFCINVNLLGNYNE